MKESSIERHLYSSSFDGKSLEKISGPSGVHKIYFNEPGSMYLDVYSDSDSPPTLVIHNKQGSVLHTLVHERPEIISDLFLLNEGESIAIFLVLAYLLFPFLLNDVLR